MAEEKLFYTIGEAAEVVDVKPYVLRYWETEFSKLNPQKTESGQRTYRKKDIQVALVIKKLLYEEKYTIAGALQKLEELEPAGLDPLDTSGVKSGEPEKAVEAAPIAAPTETTSTPTAQPSYPREKVLEMRELIRNTRVLLKKYNVI